MGARGPRPGWKADRQLAAQAAQREAEKAALRSVPPVGPAPAEPATQAVAGMSWSDRNNPRYLSGEALKEFAHRKGMARTDLLEMGDVKIREQLRYIEARHYGETAEA